MDQPPTSKLPEQNFTTAPEIGILPRDTDRHTLKARSPLCVGGILWPEPMRCVAAWRSYR